MNGNNADSSERCTYSVEVECDPDVAPDVANVWMVFCNTVRDIEGAEITDARADPEGLERSNQRENQ